jgi:hypothetical protein
MVPMHDGTLLNTFVFLPALYWRTGDIAKRFASVTPPTRCVHGSAYQDRPPARRWMSGHKCPGAANENARPQLSERAERCREGDA